MVPEGIHDNIIFHAGEFGKEFNQILTNRFKAKGIDVTSEQFAILAVLWYTQGMTQKELSEQLLRDKTTISRVIDTMIKRDLIIRATDENDRRSKKIFLTDKGKSLQKELVEIGGQLYMECLEGIPDSSVQIALFTLRRMRENLV